MNSKSSATPPNATSPPESKNPRTSDTPDAPKLDLSSPPTTKAWPKPTPSATPKAKVAIPPPPPANNGVKRATQMLAKHRATQLRVSQPPVHMPAGDSDGAQPPAQARVRLRALARSR